MLYWLVTYQIVLGAVDNSNFDIPRLVEINYQQTLTIMVPKSHRYYL